MFNEHTWDWEKQLLEETLPVCSSLYRPFLFGIPQSFQTLRCRFALFFFICCFLGLKALWIKSKYELATNESEKNALVEEMKGLVASSDGMPSVALYASQLYFSHGMTKDALQCVHLGTTLEHMSMALQIYLKLDRLDLAQSQLDAMRSTDEDAVLTSLSAVHVALAGGSSTASDAAHLLSALSEQYGPSPLLLNLSACAYCMTGDYEEAETKLLDCQRDFSQSPAHSDTLINLIVVSQYLEKPYESYLLELQKMFPTHPFLAGLERVEGAFAREALKYKVTAA
jgi:coatomer subunit epsilon